MGNYHDGMAFDASDFDDDFDSSVPSKKLKNISSFQNIEIDENENSESKAFKQALKHKTDTSSYNGTKMEIISPEEANNQATKQKLDSMNKLTEEYADPVLAIAVKNIEAKIGRKINYDEFDKLCRTYAAELVNRDAEIKGNGERPNPIDYNSYYETLIQNKKVIPAYKMRMSKYENSLVSEIDDLLTQAKKYDESDLHINRGDPINIRHNGRVIIRDESKNREIVINNKNDVKLLHMKYRQDFLDKKYKDQIDKEANGYSHDSDGFE